METAVLIDESVVEKLFGEYFDVLFVDMTVFDLHILNAVGDLVSQNVGVDLVGTARYH